jgi:hypothetical protein
VKRPMLPKLSGLLDDYRARRFLKAGQRSVQDAIAPEWTQNTPTEFGYGNHGYECWTRTLAVRDLPAKLAPGWLSPYLFGFGDVQVVQHVDPIPKKVALKRLRAQRTVRTSTAQDRQDRGAITDPAELADLGSAEEMAVAVESGAESLFSVGLYLVLRAPTVVDLDVLERAVRDHLDNGFRLVSTRWQHAAGYRSAGILPTTDKLRVRRTLDTTTLAFSVPFLSANAGTRAGPWLAIQHADAAPLFLDFWSRSEGWNAPMLCIVSPPGGGKSVTIATWVCRHLTLPEPVSVILVDPEKGDYRGLVNALGGQIVRISTDPGLVINPLDLPPYAYQSGTGEDSVQNPVLTQARLVTGLIALMVAEPGLNGSPGRMTKTERSVVEQAILSAYADYGILPHETATWDVSPRDTPTLRDVLAKLERDSDAGTLATRLRLYTTGTLSGLFSGHTTLKLDSHLTSFDLEGIDEESRPLAVWLIGDFTWKLAKRDRQRRILSMDEVKTLLENPESARLVAHLYTLGRAYNLSVWSATQLLSDYTTTPEGERALQSADTVLLLRQARGKGAEDAARRYSLSDGDRLFLETANEGNGILCTPHGAARVAVRPSPLELSLMQPKARAPIDAAATTA